MEIPRLTTAQTAARLGVKPQTLYAYVSRGVLTSERGDTGSTFDALEVEALADARGARARRAAAGSAAAATEPSEPSDAGRPLMVIDSPITLLHGDDLYFRGRRATELARGTGFERAVELLWDTGLEVPETAVRTEAHFAPDRQVMSRARAAGDLLGPSARLLDRLALTVQIAASYDPLRDDLARDAVHSSARRLIAEMVAVLPLRGDPAHPEAPLARHLWSRLSEQEPTPGDVALLDSLLVLSMDHDLATSTMAARVAASGRANPYAALSAALGAVDSTHHGSASAAAVELLRESLDSGQPEKALASRIRAGRLLPGFGHLVYRERDPRAVFAFEAMGRLPRYRVATAGAARLTAIVRSRLPRPANVDLALATFVVGAGLPDDAGQVIFAVARTAGWIAHIVDEYDQPPVRMRPESRYTGPVPI